ncbi:MAG TPA: 23S rRNA (adenine(2503)-C(2))-methyltransferase RlmN [Gemmatimonadales bacterium]|nr:23S rRNA (adenine(2503)-C(2))-methyltransferase RlmN [Gemmatimonadales bacterium]
MNNLLDLVPAAARDALGTWLAGRGEPPYRLTQVLPRLWQRPVRRWTDATDLPVALREALDAEWPLPSLVLETRQVSGDGTEKMLWRLPDGEAIESVLIPEGARRTLCISSQAGCPLRCAFCATGTMGLKRNLAAWEIAAQVRELLLAAEPVTPTNVVFMGMGEPLLNWPAVSAALTLLNHPDALGIGARHITVSTVGILPSLAELAKRPEQFRLAVSLHAPTSATRLTLMPIEKRYHLGDLLAALTAFRRRVTFEYVLIDGVNDRDEDLVELARIARRAGAMVNLLPLHPGGAPGLAPTPRGRIAGFAAGLRRRGVEAVARRSRGLDIAAACGQLRILRGEPGGEVPAQAHGDVHQPAGIRELAHRPDA